MERFRTGILLVALFLGLSCRSSDPRKEDTPASHGKGEPKGPGTAIAANFSHATVAVDTVVITDSLRYTAYLYVTKVSPGDRLPSLAEPGAHIAASPVYMRSAGGKVDIAAERNSGLFALRRAKAGDTLEVTVSLLSDGSWSLVGAGKR